MCRTVLICVNSIQILFFPTVILSSCGGVERLFERQDIDAVMSSFLMYLFVLIRFL